MKVFTKTLLALSILLVVTAQAQTTKKAAPTKTATPVNKTTAKKAPAKKPVQKLKKSTSVPAICYCSLLS